MDETVTRPAEGLSQIVESARRLGVELDEQEASEWLAAMQTEAAGGDIVIDVDSGVYGHRVTMLDFTPADIARFREIGKVIGEALTGSFGESEVAALSERTRALAERHPLYPHLDAPAAV